MLLPLTPIRRNSMPLWNAKLTDILLTAQDPKGASEYWARLLGGEPEGDGVLLGDGTAVKVREGATEGLAEVGFEAGAELVAAAERQGAELREGAVVVADPDGWQLRIDPVAEVAPQVVEGPILSHCTLASAEPPRQRGWYEQLGFQLSDALGDVFFWMRPNPIHHAMAFCKGERAGIHHLAIELPDRAAFIGAIDNIVAAGAVLEFGPGRHMVGGNLFAYLVDRYGIRWELCAEMGRLEQDREPGMHSAADRGRSVNTYGPPPPASFLKEPGGPQT
jgi:catechol 2,3-dioxygenase-like lactoylglutathione lyase family enzyme